MRVFILSQKGERERDAIHEKDKLGVTEFHRQGKKDNPRYVQDQQPYTHIPRDKGTQSEQNKSRELRAITLTKHR